MGRTGAGGVGAREAVTGAGAGRRVGGGITGMGAFSSDASRREESFETLGSAEPLTRRLEVEAEVVWST